MRRDGSHFFTTSYSPPPQTSLSPPLSLWNDCYVLQFDFVYISLSLFLSTDVFLLPSLFPTLYEVHLSLHYMVSAVLWSLHLQSKHRGLCCFPCRADGSEMLLFSLRAWEPLSQPLCMLFDADRKHSKRGKIARSQYKTCISVLYFLMIAPSFWLCMFCPFWWVPTYLPTYLPGHKISLPTSSVTLNWY